MTRALYQHMEWADATVWRAVAATPGAEDDKTLRDRLLHIHTVQHAYLILWRGGALNLPGPSHFPDLASIRNWARDYYRLVTEYLAELDDTKLDEPLKIPWTAQVEERFGRSIAAVTQRETLMQIPMHSHYHRGQVNTRLRELGATPPLVDFIAWAWFGKPGAEWP